MDFGHAIIYVDDVRKRVEFYEQAFGIERGFVHESGQLAQMGTETLIGIASPIGA